MLVEFVVPWKPLEQRARGRGFGVDLVSVLEILDSLDLQPRVHLFLRVVGSILLVVPGNLRWFPVA